RILEESTLPRRPRPGPRADCAGILIKPALAHSRTRAHAHAHEHVNDSRRLCQVQGRKSSALA
ncbi:jg484, partial [Pararge aegeria aegeria]